MTPQNEAMSNPLASRRCFDPRIAGRLVALTGINKACDPAGISVTRGSGQRTRRRPSARQSGRKPTGRCDP